MKKDVAVSENKRMQGLRHWLWCEKELRPLFLYDKLFNLAHLCQCGLFTGGNGFLSQIEIIHGHEPQLRPNDDIRLGQVLRDNG